MLDYLMYLALARAGVVNARASGCGRASEISAEFVNPRPTEWVPAPNKHRLR